MNHIILSENAGMLIIAFIVDNYTIYYVVIDDDPNAPVMEVRRFLYNGQNRDGLV